MSAPCASCALSFDIERHLVPRPMQIEREPAPIGARGDGDDADEGGGGALTILCCPCRTCWAGVKAVGAAQKRAAELSQKCCKKGCDCLCPCC